MTQKINKSDSVDIEEAKLTYEFFMNAPVSMWACDRNFRIVLWNPGAEIIYGRSKNEVIGKNYLELFISPPEREQSKKDCIRIIDCNWKQNNCLAYDTNETGERRHMLTNSFRILSPETGEYLQAEIAVEISDLGLRLDEHRSLREIGIKKLAMEGQSLEIEKLGLLQLVEKVILDMTINFKARQNDLKRWADNLRSSKIRETSVSAEDALEELKKRFLLSRQKLDELKDQISDAVSLEDIKNLRKSFQNLTSDLDKTQINNEEEKCD